MLALFQSLGLAYASGVSVYATVLLIGLMERAQWIPPMPGLLGFASNTIVLIVAAALTVVELTAQMIPGVATVWETVHTAIRPPAAALLAIATAWHASPIIVVTAALLGGGIGLATHATKLGLRVAVDASPEPVTNGLLSVTELGVLASVSFFVWTHPIITLVVALTLLVLTALLVRLVWRTIGRVVTELFGGRWRDALSVAGTPSGTR
jgi:hypothetical protein